MSDLSRDTGNPSGRRMGTTWSNGSEPAGFIHLQCTARVPDEVWVPKRFLQCDAYHHFTGSHPGRDALRSAVPCKYFTSAVGEYGRCLGSGHDIAAGESDLPWRQNPGGSDLTEQDVHQQQRDEDEHGRHHQRCGCQIGLRYHIAVNAPEHTRYGGEKSDYNRSECDNPGGMLS